MSVPILLTKLFVPPARPELVTRSRLIEQLNRNLHRKLTLVSAPAGFGKTTLVIDWLQSKGDDMPSPFLLGWLSLDEGDNDVVRFMTYLITALNRIQRSETEIGVGALQMLKSPQPPPAETILINVINEIAVMSEKIVLILDDFHLIDSQQVHESLNFLIENQPPQLHLIITTREDPPIPISRLRTRGQLKEVRALDLRFTVEETAVFLNQVMDLNLSAAHIATLETRTEGWIAGLQLAAISMRGFEDASGFIDSFSGSNRYVLDYLLEEILDQQPESIKTFLLKTAVTDRLTGDLCDAVTGQNNGQEILETLEHANLFIVPLDNDRRWYRYHHLFSDLLFQRLRQTQPDKIQILHIKAGEWYSRQGMKREAIKHSLAGKNYQGAADMIKSIALDTMQQGEHTTIVRWINTIPEELIKEEPYLCVLHAWAMQLTGQLETSEARLIDCENALNYHQNDEDRDIVLGLINFRRAYASFMTGELDKTISYAKQALDQLPETAALIRVHTVLYLGVAYRYQGQLQEALDTYEKILPITERMGGKSVAVLHYIHLSDVYWLMGQLHRAKELCEQALTLTEQNIGRPDMPYCGFVYVRIGRILRQWNQLQESHQLTEKGIALCKDWNVADVLALSYIELAYVFQALENDEQSRASIQKAIQIMDKFSPWGSKIAAAHQAKMDWARGDIEAVERWAEANELVIDGEFVPDRENDYLILVRLFIVQKRFEEAHALAIRIHKITFETGKRHTLLETHMLLALLFFTKGETDQAFVHLGKALTIAQPEGFIRIFVDEGPPMARLLYTALSQGIAPDYIEKLLTAFPIETPEQIPQPLTKTHKDELFDPLSDREIEVLRLIAEGLSRPEIAAKLFLSKNTVKTHARNIYSKLGVNNQMQAVGKARALGLLENA